MTDKLIPGQWYEDSNDERCLAFGSDDVVYRDGITTIDVKPKAIKRFTHLPDCTGWDWQPPKPPLKVEVGKWYRCRDGSATKIVGYREGATYGEYCYRDKFGMTYRIDGAWTFKPSQHDLVEEIPEPEPDYIELHKASGLKVGDRVRIEKKTEPKGWAPNWNPDMGSEVGKVGSVASDESESGFRVQTDSTYPWYFPATSLVKVEPKWRPFANADEFKPYRDRWWRYKNDHPTNIRPPGAYDVHGFVGHKWERCLEILEFEAGAPFGIEVTE